MLKKGGLAVINKHITEICIRDLQMLIDNEVGEGKSLEYKSELNIGSGDERKEFLADISSFANSIHLLRLARTGI